MTVNRIKIESAKFLYSLWGEEPEMTKAGNLTQKAYNKLIKAGYYWFPGQRAWCYRPDIREANFKKAEEITRRRSEL